MNDFSIMEKLLYYNLVSMLFICDQGLLAEYIQYMKEFKPMCEVISEEIFGKIQ